jgi:hypothetical protein
MVNLMNLNTISLISEILHGISNRPILPSFPVTKYGMAKGGQKWILITCQEQSWCDLGDQIEWEQLPSMVMVRLDVCQWQRERSTNKQQPMPVYTTYQKQSDQQPTLVYTIYQL